MYVYVVVLKSMCTSNAMKMVPDLHYCEPDQNYFYCKCEAFVRNQYLKLGFLIGNIRKIILQLIYDFKNDN